mmetsp:Transcript_39889/g.81674  ORF Transcript_39889/g.81674 Transcript_39889/m.81674 type:complete len:117 (-) Transcript_39889:281-631(-)|eukprot:CAMPEP_0181305422 /NCGR_PEP_ID=MMETSP1101-20121128/9721_1 /TAXON_ID=46948 /ORGANISM="Rhodomonas abbreviata, Strain Caron Lab Isolate" /LENGTH=116 /DNA_ID=CAMNT_0023411337 /DNA_START=166 /DNA_END=516 /DNA_ORIENTATION=+
MWRGGGKPGKEGGVSAADAATGDQMEKENDNLLGELHNKVNALKSVTIAINGEVNQQNEQLEQMQTGMGMAGGLFGNTFKKVETMFSSHGNQSIMLMAGIGVLAFLLIYLLVRLRA